MCLVYSKFDERTCCPSRIIEFVDYCNICPDGITASEFFIPRSEGETCKQLVQNAKIYENGSVGCNYYRGSFEMSCCPAGLENPPPSSTSIPDISPPISTSSETSYAPTPSLTPTNSLYIVEVTAAIVGAVQVIVQDLVGRQDLGELVECVCLCNKCYLSYYLGL